MMPDIKCVSNFYRDSAGMVHYYDDSYCGCSNELPIRSSISDFYHQSNPIAFPTNIHSQFQDENNFELSSNVTCTHENQNSSLNQVHECRTFFHNHYAFANLILDVDQTEHMERCSITESDGTESVATVASSRMITPMVGCWLNTWQ
jgi:hypothetical protein